MRKRAVRNWLAAGAVIALLAAAGLEVALRIHASLRWDAPFFVSDPETGFRARPGVEIEGNRLNSLGYNDVERGPAPPAGWRRVAIIGDSFVFGAGRREENMVAALQSFADRDNAKLEVLNVGIIGAGPPIYRAVLAKEATRFRATSAIVLIFLGNDIAESHPDFKARVWMGNVRLVLREPYLVGASLEYLMLHRLGRGMLRQYYSLLDPPEAGMFAEASYLYLEYQRAEVFRRRPSRFVRACYTAVLADLRGISATAAAKGVQLAVVLAPDEIQVDPQLQQAVSRAWSLDLADYDFDAQVASLAAPLSAEGVRVIDLTPAFRRVLAETPLYRVRHSHWNTAGNRLAAETIWHELRRSRFFE